MSNKLDDYIGYCVKLGMNGGPYSPWDGSWPPAPGPPFYLDSGNYSYDYVGTYGANCLTGGTVVVSPGTEKSYKRVYRGEVITIQTAGGHQLTGTPNHPILTSRGWLPLNTLRKGDHVISSSGFRQLAALEPDIYGEPAPLEKHHRALANTGHAHRKDSLPPDFHGDGMKGKIDVVFANGELRNNIQPSLLEKPTKFTLPLKYAREGALSPQSASRQSLLRLFSAPEGFVGRLGASLAQVPVNSGGADTEFRGDALRRLPTDVRLDEIINITTRAFSGHVYNLQTETGWYIANGIVTHNCAGALDLPLWWVGLGPVGGTLAWGELLLASGNWWERFVPEKRYPRGTFLLQPYGTGVGGEGHIAVVTDGSSQQIFQSDSYYGLNVRKTVMQQHYYTPWLYAAFHPDLIPPEAGGSSSSPLGKYDYPGDCADPAPVARYFARVAHDLYGLPPVLPVMTSYVELTAAWSAPGCVYDIPGYSYAVDYSSLGYFQQRPEWWGTPDQLRDATYALNAFCKAAYDVSGGSWNKSLSDPKELGRWCQQVQNSAYPEAYANKGYAPAMKLIAGWDTEYSEADEKPDPGPSPGPDPKPQPGGELTQWQKWGWYTFPEDNSWDLKYYPAEGKDSPLPTPTKRKARVKREEVEYYRAEDGDYVVMLDGQEWEMDEKSFKQFYKEID